MAILISCQDLHKSYHARQLLNGLSFAVNERERLGIIGPNGAGKSTLLRILAAREELDRGEVASRRGLRVSYVAQVSEMPPDATALDVLSQNNADPLSANMLLSQLGLAPDARVGTLSGGWRKRLSIASALVQEPDVLLLDEPTNHLDLDGILWLEQLLKNAAFAWVMVSHDRYVLERAATRIAEVNHIYPTGAFISDGAYSSFLLKRAEYLAQQQKLSETLANKARREVAWLRRGPQARTTKARYRIDEANKLIGELADVRARLRGSEAEIDFAATGRKTKRLVVLDSASKKMGERPVISALNLVITPGMRFGVMGPNGAGKTTLLRLIAGELKADAGTITAADGLKVVYFDQDRARLPADRTLRDFLCEGSDSVVFRGQSLHAVTWAKRFLFRTEQLDLRTGDLSGGEQARALVAKLVLEPADILLLDEPTNDLDIPTLETLEESLQDFPGAIVLVSHDRYFLDQVTNATLGLDGSGAVGLYADYEQWEEARAALRAKATPRPIATTPEIGTAAPTSGRPKNAARRLSYLEQREFDGMEAAITAAEAALAEKTAAAGNPEISSSATAAARAYEELKAAESEVERLYARWSELAAKTE